MNTTGGNWSGGSCAGGFSVGFNTPNFPQVSIGLRGIYLAADTDDGRHARQAFNTYFGLEFIALGVRGLGPEIEIPEMGGEMI